MEHTKIRMVVTDLDDTLLSKEKEISEEAARVIESLQEKGVKFTFITGRPPYAIERFARKVAITAPMVACNGAMLVDHITGEISEKTSLDFKPLLPLLEKAKEIGHTVLILAGDVEYALGETSWTRVRAEAGRALPFADLEFIAEQGAVYKVNIMEEKGKEPFVSLLPLLEEVREHYAIALYGTTGCEIVAKGVNKELGLRKLCAICGVKPEEVLAVGDNENDLEMLRAAGVGAAVGNCAEKVREAADYVCQENYTQGVLEAIEKFVS